MTVTPCVSKATASLTKGEEALSQVDWVDQSRVHFKCHFAEQASGASCGYTYQLHLDNEVDKGVDLSRYRNLCEDVLSVNAVEYEDFGIGASVVLEEYADPDQVLAQLFFVIYKYFTPSIPFHTIQQMLDRGYAVDEIFEGPALRHGFIDTEELEKTDLFRDIERRIDRTFRG